jgi:hypothetical protein
MDDFVDSSVVDPEWVGPDDFVDPSLLDEELVDAVARRYGLLL